MLLITTISMFRKLCFCILIFCLISFNSSAQSLIWKEINLSVWKNTIGKPDSLTLLTAGRIMTLKVDHNISNDNGKTRAQVPIRHYGEQTGIFMILDDDDNISLC